MIHELGSTWRKWDLHIHTPASHTASYGSDDEAWARFLADLAALPSDFAVIGINDYIWVDGYERVRTAHLGGQLPNIEAVFPVVELRIADFIGTTSHLAKLNVHAIFGPNTDPELIRSQFIARLVGDFKLKDPYKALSSKWKAVPTRDALKDLGRLIKESVPPEKLPDYGSDLEEGFNNWVIAFDRVKEALDGSSFEEPPLIGLGKTEWEDIPWNDNTVATKKSLINESDLIFTAAPTPGACHQSVERLRESKVNHRLLDCSDAHAYSQSDYKDRIGNCFTWICADPTLAGLKHALLEYEARVYVGDKPPLLTRRESDPTNFITRVLITPSDPATRPNPSFDIDLTLNPGFAAVIGNKGSGKSALLDSMALAANSHSEDDFTFLSERRYRNPRNYKAPHYQVAIQTADGDSIGPVSLASSTNLDVPERIRYLPQSLLEKLCNKEPGSPDDEFEGELRSIIFSHIPEHKRLGARSLDELLDQRANALDRQIAHERVRLAEVNNSIVQLEELARPSRIKALEASLLSVNKQISNHDSARPPDPVAPSPEAEKSPEAERLDELKAAISKLEDEQARDEKEYQALLSRMDATASLVREIEVFRSAHEDFINRVTELASQVDLDIAAIVDVKFNMKPIDDLREAAARDLEVLEARISPDSTNSKEKANLLVRKKELESLLDEPRRQFELQKNELQAWEEVRNQLIGSATQERSQQYHVSQIAEVETLPDRLQQLREDRLKASRAIHSLLLEKVDMHRELYAPVQEFLDSQSLARQQFSLEFAAQLEIRTFTDPFLSYIDRGSAGSFYGVEASTKRVDQRVKRIQPGDWDSVADFLQEHEADLHSDRRTSPPTPMDNPADLLRSGVTMADLYNFLYGLSYIGAEYELRSEGRSISELSPGQKGTILLMFYLLVDQSGMPIALDQPDENLDNQTIHTLLRPAIRSAKQTRQVFVVTHSPNLAVVGDADQVIVALGDEKEFRYTAGSIESPAIRDLVVSVLEGDWPAFTDRGRKYSVAKLDGETIEPTV